MTHNMMQQEGHGLPLSDQGAFPVHDAGNPSTKADGTLTTYPMDLPPPHMMYATSEPVTQTATDDDYTEPSVWDMWRKPRPPIVRIHRVGPPICTVHDLTQPGATYGKQGRCRACHNLHNAKYRATHGLSTNAPRKTHCIHGHPRTADNVNKHGACMTCVEIKNEKRRHEYQAKEQVTQ